MASKKLPSSRKPGSRKAAAGPPQQDARALYLQQLLEDLPKQLPESFATGLETVGRAPAAAAAETLESFRRTGALDAAQRQIVEAIVVPYLRPVIDVQQDSYEKLTAPWTPLNQSRAKVENAIRAVGRVEVFGLPGVPYGGTGSIVGPNLLMTNRHVAELVTPAVGFTQLIFHPGRSAGLDFKQEVGSNESILVKVKRVRLVHPYWDAAFLEVEGLPPNRPALQLLSRPPASLAKLLVAVIGYPAFDGRSDAGMQMTMFRGVFQKKRLLPGYTRNFRDINSFGNVVSALSHDCSTLGGNSGSAVVDPKSGHIVGLHFAGIHLESNFAVPAWELAKDPKVVDLGVNFTPKPARGTAPPAWLKAWNGLETSPVAAAKPAVRPPKKAEAAASPETGAALQPAEWFERSRPEDLARALETAPAATAAALEQVLGPQEAAAVIKDLTPPKRTESAEATEGLFDLFDPPPDPNLPEIIWLHGIMGGHLARPGFLRNRIWLDLKELPLGAISSSLALAPDCSSQQDGRRFLEPDGMLQMFYGHAERQWRKNRFVVHPFSYDWRLPVASLADRLHLFIQQLRQQNPARRLMLVAHSMGGLVCSLYAQRHGEWRDAIVRAVFMGSPLGGSFAPIQAGIGTYDLLRKMLLVTLRDSPESMRRMAASLPGLMDMLPNPALFPDAEAAYQTNTWPDGIAPMQRWLDQSRNLKTQLWNSPLLERTTLLVTTKVGTVGGLRRGAALAEAPPTVAGDGTVPARAAAVPGVPAFLVDKDHGSIPKDPKAVQAVMDLARFGACNLAKVSEADLKAKVAPPESVEMPEAALEGMQTRMATGQLRAEDLEWIFAPGLGRPPASRR